MTTYDYQLAVHRVPKKPLLLPHDVEEVFMLRMEDRGDGNGFNMAFSGPVTPTQLAAEAAELLEEFIWRARQLDMKAGMT